MASNRDELYKSQLVELLQGGFAPNVILLKEFDYTKAGIILEGLHFSAWILLGHIHSRHDDFLEFMKNPGAGKETWPEAYWPENYQPKTKEEWETAIHNYKKELQEMIDLVSDPETDLFKEYTDGKTISWAALCVLHHTGYHIGQLKAIGRQLGVW